MVPRNLAAGVARRQVQDYRPVVLRVGENIEVANARVDVERLILPAGPFGPPDDVVVACLRVAEVRLPHHVQSHGRHAPDDGVHGPAVDGPAGQLLGCEGCRILGRSGLGYQQQADDHW